MLLFSSVQKEHFHTAFGGKFITFQHTKFNVAYVFYKFIVIHQKSLSSVKENTYFMLMPFLREKKETFTNLYFPKVYH